MSYKCLTQNEAFWFDTYNQAAQFAGCGYLLEQLDGKFYLRNANGDFIKDLKAWWKHEPRAENLFFERLYHVKP